MREGGGDKKRTERIWSKAKKKNKWKSLRERAESKEQGRKSDNRTLVLYGPILTARNGYNALAYAYWRMRAHRALLCLLLFAAAASACNRMYFCEHVSTLRAHSDQRKFARHLFERIACGNCCRPMLVCLPLLTVAAHECSKMMAVAVSSPPMQRWVNPLRVTVSGTS
eukprot:4101499-Pleurochrysis_carterae.AAC.1